jgi:hypothetical protein
MANSNKKKVIYNRNITEPKALDCNCNSHYDCCDCGGNDCGCGYCFSCNCCELCRIECDMD